MEENICYCCLGAGLHCWDYRGVPQLLLRCTERALFPEIWQPASWEEVWRWLMIFVRVRMALQTIRANPQYITSLDSSKGGTKYLLALWKLNFLSLPGHSVQFSRSVVSDSLWPHESQHARPPCPSPTPGVHSDSHPSSQWCHPAISSSVIPFSSCPQSLPASESFPMRQLFAWGGQSTGVSALASFLPEKSQGWSPSEWTGWISLQSLGLSRVFSNTTVQKHQFFGAQLSSQSNSHIHTWPLEKP